MPITFLHAADIHLDSPLRGLERYENAPVEKIRSATRHAFTRLIDLAIEQKVNFLVIAGDLYDGDLRDFQTLLYLSREFSRLRDHNIKVYMIAGNHDAANKMTRSLPLPQNVKLLAHDGPETIHLPDLGVAIHGQSFKHAAVTDNLAITYPPPVSGYVNIGLLHTGLTGLEGHERYAPCTLDDLKQRGYDYWALGHVHTRQTPNDADPHIVFPGNVQGRHIRESGRKGCILVTVDSDHRIETRFERLDCVRWERAQVDLSDVANESDALTRTAEILDHLLATEPDPDVMLAVRVTLSGSSPLHTKFHADRDRLVNSIRAIAIDRGADRLWIERVELQTQPPRTAAAVDGPLEELLDLFAHLGANPSNLAELIADDDDLADLKRKLPAEMIHDPECPRPTDCDWLHSLLPTVQPLLLDLLGKSSGFATDSRPGS
jgi:DNA repair protein SbcD/Mre11